MTSILQAEPIGKVVVGVGTHKYIHTAVAVDIVGGVQGTTRVSADRGGHEQLDSWARQFGQALAFGATRHRLLRRRTRLPPAQTRPQAGRGQPTRPASAPPARQVRPDRRGEHRPRGPGWHRHRDSQEWRGTARGRARRSWVWAAMTSQVQRSAASGSRSFGAVQPSVCLIILKVCSRSNLRRNDLPEPVRIGGRGIGA